MTERTPLVVKEYNGAAAAQSPPNVTVHVDVRPEAGGWPTPPGLFACTPALLPAPEWPISFDHTHSLLTRQEVTDESYERLERLHAIGLDKGWSPEFLMRRRETIDAVVERPRFFSTDDMGLLDEAKPPTKEELRSFAWMPRSGQGTLQAEQLAAQLSRKPATKRFRKGYSNWRSGNSKGAKGEFSSALTGKGVGGEDLAQDRSMVGTYDREQLLSELDSGMEQFRKFQERQPSFKIVAPGDRPAEVVEVEPALAGSSFVQTLFNTLNSTIGLSLFALPYTMSQMGWIFLPVLLSVACVARYTIGLGDEMQRDFGSVSFPDMATAAFGRWGRLFSGVLAYTDLFVWGLLCFLACVTAIKVLVNTWFQLAYNTDEVTLTDNAPIEYFCLIMFLPCCVLGDLSCLSYVSAFGLFAMCIALGITALYVAIYADWANEEQTLAETEIFGERAFSSTGTLLYQFAINAMFPSLRSSMAHPERAMEVANVNLCVVVFLTTALCTFSYVAFGSHPYAMISSVTEGSVAGIVVNASVIVMAYTKYPLYMCPVTAALIEILDGCVAPKPAAADPPALGLEASPADSSGKLAGEGEGTGQTFDLASQSPAKSFAVRVAILFLVFFVGVNCSGFVGVIETAGWIVAPLLMVIMPVCMYLQAYSAALKPLPKAGFLVALVGTIGLSAYGTYCQMA